MSKTADRFHKICLRGFYLNILIDGFIHNLLNMKVKVNVSTAGTYDEWLKTEFYNWDTTVIKLGRSKI